MQNFSTKINQQLKIVNLELGQLKIQALEEKNVLAETVIEMLTKDITNFHNIKDKQKSPDFFMQAKKDILQSLSKIEFKKLDKNILKIEKVKNGVNNIYELFYYQEKMVLNEGAERVAKLARSIKAGDISLAEASTEKDFLQKAINIFQKTNSDPDIDSLKEALNKINTNSLKKDFDSFYKQETIFFNTMILQNKDNLISFIKVAKKQDKKLNDSKSLKQLAKIESDVLKLLNFQVNKENFHAFAKVYDKTQSHIKNCINTDLPYPIRIKLRDIFIENNRFYKNVFYQKEIILTNGKAEIKLLESLIGNKKQFHKCKSFIKKSIFFLSKKEEYIIEKLDLENMLNKVVMKEKRIPNLLSKRQEKKIRKEKILKNVDVISNNIDKLVNLNSNFVTIGEEISKTEIILKKLAKERKSKPLDLFRLHKRFVKSSLERKISFQLKKQNNSLSSYISRNLYKSM